MEKYNELTFFDPQIAPLPPTFTRDRRSERPELAGSKMALLFFPDFQNSVTLEIPVHNLLWRRTQWFFLPISIVAYHHERVCIRRMKLIWNKKSNIHWDIANPDRSSFVTMVHLYFLNVCDFCDYLSHTHKIPAHPIIHKSNWYWSLSRILYPTYMDQYYVNKLLLPIFAISVKGWIMKFIRHKKSN